MSQQSSGVFIDIAGYMMAKDDNGKQYVVSLCAHFCFVFTAP